MKLYKFRSLSSDDDFKRAKRILETGEFWCSNFWELNDPMEGIYYTSKSDDYINEIFKAKKKYNICSFSGKKAFNVLTMWGYYANGFKGIAIEIEIHEDNVKKIKYVKELPDTDITAEKILTTKLTPWKKEDEYRFLTEVDGHLHKIGKITSVYFGNPYGDIVNSSHTSVEKVIRDYIERKNKLIDVTKSCKQKIFSVNIKNSKVEKIKIK